MMRPEYRKLKDNLSSYLGMLSMVVIAALIIIASTLIFGSTARRAADETTISLGKFYLEEIADRNIYEISAELDRNVGQLQRALEEMRRADLQTQEALRAFLALVQNLNGLDMFAVVDEAGMVYTSENTFSGISRFGFLSEPIDDTRLYTAHSSRSRAMVLIAMPAEDLFVGDTHMVSCITGVDVDKIVTAQQIQGENNQVLCRMFDGDDGTCIVETEGRYADGSSIFDVWKNDCSFSGEYSCEQLIADWNDHVEGYAYYTAKEGSTYLYYKPVPGTDWMVSVRLRKNAISTQILESSNKTLRGSRIQLCVVILVMLAASLMAIRQVRRNQSERFAREKEEELLRQEARVSEEKLKLQERLLKEEKAASRQASVLQILSKEYSSVYYVDLEEDTGVPIRLSDVSFDVYGLELNRTYSFSKVFESYIRCSSTPEQAEELLRFADPEFLRSTLKDNEILTHLYRIIREGRELYVQLRIARVEAEENFRHVVVGFAVVDEAIRAEQERQRALMDALAQAERASRAKTTFLNNMSHDIRTPMNAIIGFTNIALKQDIAPEVRDCLGKISESSEHLLTLINDVLDISRIESGKTSYTPVPLDITTVIDGVLDITYGFLTDRDLDFRVHRSRPEHPYVLADAIRIREVLVNILSNAVKFTNDGGTITFETSYRPGADERHIVVRYRVSDTGVGMSEEFMTRIFDEFSQEESGARTQYKGTGLGMTITKRYVDMMGGTIAVESRKGEGSTFTVELPMELIDASRVPHSDSPAAHSDMAGVKVLLTEDNDLNAEIAMVQLEEDGMSVTRAADGGEAVELFAQNPPGTFDVILMDIMMPGMNGYEATAAIRALPNRPDARRIPIIAMTANAFAEDVQASLNAGMNGHIAKPIVMDEVIKTISRNLDRRG
ncbi:MAG: ATP-binding protein [Candidatus Fimadaptatus sp.]